MGGRGDGREGEGKRADVRCLNTRFRWANERLDPMLIILQGNILSSGSFKWSPAATLSMIPNEHPSV